MLKSRGTPEFNQEAEAYNQYSTKHVMAQYLEDKRKVHPDVSAKGNEYFVTEQPIHFFATISTKWFVVFGVLLLAAGGVGYAVSISDGSGNDGDSSSTDGASSTSSGYDSFVVTSQISSGYADCTYDSATASSGSWSTAEFCEFRSKSGCDLDSIAAYACVPACLENDPNVFCDSMSTLALNCDDASGGSLITHAELQTACVASYAASAETLTEISFETSTSLAGVSASSLQADQTAQYAARVTMSLAMSSVPVDQVTITTITDSVDGRRRRSREVSDADTEAPRLLTSSGVNIEFAVTAQLEQLGYTSAGAADAHAALVTEIAASVDSGEFVQNLQANSNSNGSSTFAAVQAIVVSQQVAEVTVAFLRTASPSASPTARPTAGPTLTPTAHPSAAPTKVPTRTPSASPTLPGATLSPTAVVTSGTPTADPSTGSPSDAPTATPTAVPSTAAPSAAPTVVPSAAPTVVPSVDPTITPTAMPTTASPSDAPSVVPTPAPSPAGETLVPTAVPTATPSALPTTSPTATPTPAPSTATPTASPSASPTVVPSAVPSTVPSAAPTEVPTVEPTTAVPTEAPSASPTAVPTDQPTHTPTVTPTAVPTGQPTRQPTSTPTGQPTSQPTDAPLGFLWAEECLETTDAFLGNTSTAVEGFPLSIAPYPKIEVALLPPSVTNVLLTLQWIAASVCSVKSVARSYGGFEWEGIGPFAVHPNCSSSGSSGCSILSRPNADGTYRVVAARAEPVSKAVAAARLLLQGTFGPTRDEVTLLVNASTYSEAVTSVHYSPNSSTVNALGWILDQIRLPPTSHRAHIRQRMNPRMMGGDESAVGLLSGPCDKGTRWHRYAFVRQDVGKELEISPSNISAPGGQCYVSLLVDGIVRTQLPSFHGNDCTFTPPAGSAVLRYLICRVDEDDGADKTYSAVKFKYSGPFAPGVASSCDSKISADLPMIYFYTPDPALTQVYGAGELVLTRVAGKAEAYYLENRPACSGAQVGTNSFIGMPDVADSGTMRYYRLDVRLLMVTNTLKEPANVNSSSGGECPTVQKNFVNVDSCVRRQSSESCSSATFADDGTVLRLDSQTMMYWFEDSSKYVYYVSGLRVDELQVPCTQGLFSRWIRQPGSCASLGITNKLDDSTGEIAISALNYHGGGDSSKNPDIRDVRLRDFTAGRVCSTSAATRGAAVDLDGDCWEHSHPNELSVYDFSLWVFEHPGSINAFRAGRRDPIRRSAEEGEFVMNYPGSHPMNRWESNFGNQRLGTRLGNVNDTVDFVDLPFDLKTTDMAARIGAESSSSSLGFEACGSRGEVASNNSLGALYIATAHQRFADQGLDRFYYFWYLGASYVFQTVSLSADDQLRQRVAWALSQFIVSMGGDIFAPNSEPFVAFHDILVHNAFGSYRDILREVSASPLMAAYLTFLGNSAFAVDGKYPDENYAREVMQLFSIGVWELNQDGTQKRHPVSGQPIPTYDNDVIMDSARVWTGWFKRAFRGNLVRMNRHESNIVDPMELSLSHRDQFPKTKVGGGYLGDTHPLCSELPPQHYLKKGARYVLHGWTSALGEFYDHVAAGSGSRARDHFAPSATASALHAALCGAAEGSVTGKCTFPPVVVLEHTVNCSGPVECGADTLRVVKMVDPLDNETLYYTYEEKPCVQLLYFNDGQASSNGNMLQCAAPDVVTIAGNVCCDLNNNVVSNAGAECLYIAEPMKFSTAAARCAAQYNATPCRHDPDMFPSIARDDHTTGEAAEWAQTCSAFQYRWSSSGCKLQAQIDSFGKASLVDPGLTGSDPSMRVNGGSMFQLLWNAPNNGSNSGSDSDSDSKFPVFKDGSCATQGCEGLSENGGTCVCDLWVQLSAVYTNATAPLPSPAEMRTKLFLGASDPADYGSGGAENGGGDTGGYTLCTTAACTSQPLVAVHLYSKGGSASPATSTSEFDADTIFELMDAVGMRSKGRYLLNRVSTVFAGADPKGAYQIPISSCQAISEFNDNFACEYAYNEADDQWAIDADTPAVGAWIILNFTKPMLVTSMVFVNRCLITARHNKQLRVEFSDGSTQTVTALDSCTEIAFPLMDVVTDYVKITVESTYGTPDATGASMIKFFGPSGVNDDAFVNLGYNFRNPPNWNPKVGSYNKVEPVNLPLYQLYEDAFRTTHAMHETDALIDVLFEHDNTAAFVSTRLIQRLVTSNPSPRYVKAVATAFRTGAYGNHTFSGVYGDLGATVTAILLDREARSPELDIDPSHGQLREPLLKVLHFLRSMDYTSKAGVEVQMDWMDVKVGQGSYQAPSVFGFLLPDYSPDGAVSKRGLVSPEAQLGTAPFIIGYLNGMSSLINFGLTHCEGGFGDSVWESKHKNCAVATLAESADGAIAYSLNSTESSRAVRAAELVEELAVLLTPGRLTNNSRTVLTAAYSDVSVSEEAALKQVLNLFVVTPEYHATNQPDIQSKRRPQKPSVASHDRPYKAVVVIFLEGGADSFNMVVPHTCAPHDLYTEYAQIRGGSLAIAQSSLLQVDVTEDSDPQPCSKFGLHPSLSFLRNAYQDGDAVVLNNIGIMAEPMTQSEFYARQKQEPLGHGGMGRAVQSLHAADKDAKGVLGRMVAAAAKLSPPMKGALYSANGAMKIVEGGPVPVIVQPSAGVVRYKNYANMKDGLAALNDNISSSVFAETFSSAVENSLTATEELGDYMDATSLAATDTFGRGSLGLQLKEVAKLISVDARTTRMERAGFIVEQRPYDSHGSFTDLAARLTELNYVMEAFSTEMKAQGLWDNVTVILVSDFGRTLTSNSQGTDHGWGGNYFMFGGSVRGGRMAGQFPSRLTESQSDVSIGRGRIIPTKPWEAVWKGIAEWWDIDDPDLLAEVLPLAGNWPSDQLFNKTHLFK